MNHYFEDVPGLGNVAVSRHAQDRMANEGITEEVFVDVLNHPMQERPDGMSVMWREGRGIRIVILLRPEPHQVAVLVKTVFKMEGAAKAKI